MPKSKEPGTAVTALKDLSAAAVDLELAGRTAAANTAATARRRTVSRERLSRVANRASIRNRDRSISAQTDVDPPEISRRDSAGSLGSDTRERRASRTIREFSSALRRQMERFKSSAKALITFALIATIVSGVLQVSWHVIFSSILAEHTNVGHSWSLVVPPFIGYIAVTIICLILLYTVRQLREDTLLQLIRQAVGLEPPEGEDDLLTSFQDIASGLQVTSVRMMPCLCVSMPYCS